MKVLGMSLFAWFSAFTGVGTVGYIMKLKTPQAWGLFLLAWIVFGTLVYHLTGIQTHAGYYLGVEKDPQYPNLSQGILCESC